MATLARQPFAPLDGARLQALTSAKNRQNAVQPSAPKRKRSAWAETDDSENVDPGLSSKRCKGSQGTAPKTGIVQKPSFALIKASISSTSIEPAKASPNISSLSQQRALLKPRAPSTKIDGHLARLPPFASSPSRGSTPRTPRRGLFRSSKRRGVPNMNHSSPPSSSLGSPAPFSLDMALKGTFSSFESRLSSTPTSLLSAPLDESGMSSSWFFEIHEDTAEQEMTNLLQHSTCVLDISSDEEYEQKARRERDEGRDKENIPPPNDISQTSSARLEPTDDMAVEKTRNPLSQLNAADYYATGCDEASVVLVPSDELEEQVSDALVDPAAETGKSGDQEDSLETTAVAELEEQVQLETTGFVEDIMTCRDSAGCVASLLEPVEGTGDSFQLWESGSSKDDEL